MRQVEALAALEPPLRFGDDRQIAARQYLDHLHAVRLRLMRCRRCKGSGVREIHGGRRTRLCSCVSMEPPEVRADLGVSVGGQPA